MLLKEPGHRVQEEGGEGAVTGTVLPRDQAGKDEGERHGADGGGVRWDGDGVGLGKGGERWVRG